MFGKEAKEALLWTIVGEGNAHRMYGKKRMMIRSGETVTNENEEEEEEERFLLRRRKRRKREEDSCTTFLSSLSSSFDRFVWSNGRERDADDEKSVLQRDVRFALGQLCAGCAGDDSDDEGSREHFVQRAATIAGEMENDFGASREWFF